ncbi:MAG: hypothetical protein IT362_05560 [Deltaproteobacteria bacterium]|nr:hypothetical protein [Deltaproteobacteria bacterium]
MKYLIQSPHTKQECLRELDEISAKGQKALGQFFWGCGQGDHTGYTIVDAKTEGEAKALVPDFIREKAKIVELIQFSPEQIRSMHKAA